MPAHGTPCVMTADHVNTLRAERIVSIDNAIPPDIVAQCREEMHRIADAGSLRTEADAPCNPGEFSIELPLWNRHKVQELLGSRPGLAHCIFTLWQLPALLGPALGLDVRVPQVRSRDRPTEPRGLQALDPRTLTLRP